MVSRDGFGRENGVLPVLVSLGVSLRQDCDSLEVEAVGQMNEGAQTVGIPPIQNRTRRGSLGRDGSKKGRHDNRGYCSQKILDIGNKRRTTGTGCFLFHSADKSLKAR
jgi:hypothetical protein